MTADSAARAPPLLERLAVRYLLRRAPATTVGEANLVHQLDAHERALLFRLQCGAIARASLAGAVSTLIAAGAELYANTLPGMDAELADLWLTAKWWALVGSVTLLTSVGEILFLYWDALRTTNAMARGAGLQLAPSGEASDRSEIAAALARAALELPNPPTPAWGVDPRKEASRARLMAAAVVYKLKVAASTFVTKALVRRVLSRAAVRTVLPFVAVPITAVWNAIVVAWVLREVRIRAMGPSAAAELVQAIIGRASFLSPEGRLACVRAVAACIVRTQDMHPNLRELLRLTRERCGDTGAEPIDDPGAFLRGLRTLASHERDTVMRLLAVAAIIDGKLSYAERRLLRQAREAAGLPPSLEAVRALRRAFVAGDPMTPELLRATAD